MFIVAEMVGSFLGRHDAIAILRQTENGKWTACFESSVGSFPVVLRDPVTASAYSFSVGEDTAGGERHAARS